MCGTGRRIQDRAPNEGAEGGRDGVADHLPQGCEADGLAGGKELVVGREALQQCGLARGDRAHLLGVAEPAAAVVVVLGRDRRGGRVPLHDAVEGLEARPGRAPVAGGAQLLGPVPPCPARTGGGPPPQIDRRQRARAVQGVVRIGLTGRQRGQTGDCVAYRGHPPFGDRAVWDRHEAVQRGDEHEPAPRLGQAVVDAPDCFEVDEVPQVGQPSQELAEHGSGLERNDVLHRHEVRTGLGHQAPELQEQVPGLVGLRISPPPLRRERLTRRAARQEPMRAVTSPQAVQVRPSDLADRLVDEARSDIAFEGPPAGWIDVDSRDDLDARLLQPARQTPRSAEQIHRRDRLTRHGPKHIPHRPSLGSPARSNGKFRKGARLTSENGHSHVRCVEAPAPAAATARPGDRMGGGIDFSAGIRSAILPV